LAAIVVCFVVAVALLIGAIVYLSRKRRAALLADPMLNEPLLGAEN